MAKYSNGLEDNLDIPQTAVSVLESRYLNKDKKGKLLETGEDMLRRVAKDIAFAEVLYQSKYTEKIKPGISREKLYKISEQDEKSRYFESEFFNMMKNRYFLPNSPTLMNAGKELQQLSACFTPDQPIFSNPGIRLISELNVGDKIITHTGSIKPITRKMIRHINENILKINIKGLFKPSLSITAEHPILGIRKEKLICIRNKNNICNGFKKKYCFKKSLEYRKDCGFLVSEITNPEWIFAKDMGVGDYVVINSVKEIKDIEELKISDIINDVIIEKGFVKSKNRPNEGKLIPNLIKIDNDFLWLLGYWLADGSISGEKPNVVRFTFNINEREYYEKVLSIIKKKFGLGAKIEINDEQHTAQLRFHSTIVARFFVSLFGKGFNNKDLPEWVMTLPQEKQFNLLMGLFQGDGCHKNNKTQDVFFVSLSNYQLATKVWNILLRLGYNFNIRSYKPKAGTTEAVRISSAPSECEDLVKAVNKNIFIKRKIFSQYVRLGNYILRPITKIEKVQYNGKVYNFEIDGDNSYLANGVAVHNCFVLPIDDSMEGIFETLKTTALVHKSGGGTGFSFSRLRPNGSYINSTKSYTPGPLSFLKIYDVGTEAVKQGGKRRGANMGILRANHPDILDWITIKEKEGIIANFNLSVAFTDSEIEAVKNNDYILLKDPRKGKEYTIENAKKRTKKFEISESYIFKTAWDLSDDEKSIIDNQTGKKIGKIENNKLYLEARSLFNKIIEGNWKTGEPGIVFIDRINQKNPTPELGMIESTNPCVIGNSLIPSEQGLIRIDELSKLQNQTEISLDTSSLLTRNNLVMEIPSSKISRAWQTGIKETFKLITKSGFELEATKDHKILTANGWEELQNLIIGDKIILQSKEGLFNNNKILQAKFRNTKVWTKELGQVIGLLIGDGWLSRSSQRVGFCFGGGDKEIFFYFKKILNNLYGKEIKEVLRKNKTIHLSYHSKEFIGFFERLGVKIAKSGSKEVPLSIFSAPREAVIGFLQGLFTADGTISVSENKTHYIRLTSKSEKLLKQVQILLINLGIKSKIYARHREKRLCFSYKNIKGEMRFYKTDGRLFELQISRDMIPVFLSKIGFILGKHKEKIKKLEKIRFHKTKFDDEVVLIIPQGKKPVFDLIEPLTHSFICNGIIVHNCGEQPLLPYESCNLGSINLSEIVKEDKQLDESLLEKIVRFSTRFLDNVIDRNKYQLKQIEDMTKANRKIGLGVMGFAHYLIKRGISYNSQEAVEEAEKVMKFINDVSKDESRKLAKERGAFPNFSKSIYKNTEPIRNATTTTIAPTGTIGVIITTSQGIEPIYEIITKRNVKGTIGKDLIEVDREFKEFLIRNKLYSENILKEISEGKTIEDLIQNESIKKEIKRLFVTAHDVQPEQHLKIQAAFQKHVDNAVSKTINMPNSATPKDIANAYLMAYGLGCKGMTTYREGSRDFQLLTSVNKKNLEERISNRKLNNGERPNVIGTTIKQKTPHGNAFITLNVFEEDYSKPYEFFVTIGKGGRDISAIAEGYGRLISLAFKNNISVESIIEQLSNISGETQTGLGENKIYSVPDAIAKGLIEAASRLNKGNKLGLVEKKHTGNLCPDCSSPLIYDEGCRGGKCLSCGYSKC